MSVHITNQIIKKEWTDYNNHMNMAYYVLVFDQVWEIMLEKFKMGESSAKNLRSESMSEVVFNGSSSRKPVSKASVELFFDNKDGRIGGEFSSYSEISVRRSLELDGHSIII